jgi:hypothetical protein
VIEPIPKIRRRLSVPHEVDLVGEALGIERKRQLSPEAKPSLAHRFAQNPTGGPVMTVHSFNSNLPVRQQPAKVALSSGYAIMTHNNVAAGF